MSLNISNKTIAVLPFINMSNSADNEYFSDGISEEIINALAKINNLKVTSRTSSFYFKGKSLPISKIGEKLKVSTILEGSVRLSGNAVRITAQLIEVKEDFHFWSETWDRKLENIFEIQDEISLLIADKLREHFGHFEIEEHLVSQATKNITAYEYCLRAKFLENKWNPQDTKKAISHYEKALELDSNYSEAKLGLAGCYSFLGTTGFMPFEEAWAKTIQFTNETLQLNDNLSGVHYQLSNQAFFIECNYGKSLLEIKKAIKINPNNAEAQQFISFLYIIAGEVEKSNQHLNIALALNPLSDETHFFRAYFHYMIEEYEKSLIMLDKCLSNNDKNIPAHSIKSLCLLQLKKYDEVINYYDSIPKDVIIEGEKLGATALAYALKNDKINSAKYLEKLKVTSQEPNGFTADSYLFLMFALLHENDKAFAWVENSIANNSSLLLLRFSDPLANSLKKDSRYLSFKKKIYHFDNQSPSSNKKPPLLDENLAEKFSSLLLNHVKENETFLNSELTLREMASQIQIHPNQLSWLLNNNIGQNFNEFINKYRVEHFKTLAKDPDKSKLTIEAIAYECGFNSKTVFNTYFKKETGLTPKQFIKS